MSQLTNDNMDHHLSRDTINLLVEMQHQLQQHGIVIKLAEPNVISHVLQATESIDDEAIAQCRKRLLALHPDTASPPRVHLFSSATGRVTCGKCRKVIRVQVHPHAGILNPQVTTCPCGEQFYIGRQHRQYARKPTQLPGTYALERDETVIGDMIVENLSYAGVLLRLKTWSGKICRDDVLLIQFSLDDKYQTLVCEPIEVRYVQDDRIGAQFHNAYGIPRPLIAYLRS